MVFTTEEITGCINEAANGANNAGRNLPSCFFFVSINTLDSSYDFMILIVSFIS